MTDTNKNTQTIELSTKQTLFIDSVIASALELVLPLSEKYLPKQDSDWFEYYDTDGYRKSFEEDQGTYCEDCSEARKQEILKDQEITFPEDFEELVIATETSKENEDFLNCDSCGEIIECAIIWTGQELDHWINCTDEDWINKKNNSYSYYQIAKILEDTYGTKEEFKEKCLLIAKSVLKHWL